MWASVTSTPRPSPPPPHTHLYDTNLRLQIIFVTWSVYTGWDRPAVDKLEINRKLGVSVWLIVTIESIKKSFNLFAFTDNDWCMYVCIRGWLIYSQCSQHLRYISCQRGYTCKIVLQSLMLSVCNYSHTDRIIHTYTLCNLHKEEETSDTNYAHPRISHRNFVQEWIYVLKCILCTILHVLPRGVEGVALSW